MIEAMTFSSTLEDVQTKDDESVMRRLFFSLPLKFTTNCSHSFNFQILRLDTHKVYPSIWIGNMVQERKGKKKTLKKEDLTTSSFVVGLFFIFLLHLESYTTL